MVLRDTYHITFYYSYIEIFRRFIFRFHWYCRRMAGEDCRNISEPRKNFHIGIVTVDRFHLSAFVFWFRPRKKYPFCKRGIGHSKESNRATTMKYATREREYSFPSIPVDNCN